MTRAGHSASWAIPPQRGGHLILNGVNSYTGTTWVHSGRLEVNGNIASSSGVRLGASSVLSGHGITSTISGSGSIEPGIGTGILTATAIDASGGLDFAFEFTLLGPPDYANAAASGNDLLHLTGFTPFTEPLTANNEVGIFLNIPAIAPSDVFLGGFFTDRNEAFLGQIQAATFLFYIADESGSVHYGGTPYSLYDGPLTFRINTVSNFANFAGGGVNGWIMTITAVPEPPECAAGFVLLLLVAVWCLRPLRA
jgi:autotransporter-associated beta strand repeat